MDTTTLIRRWKMWDRPALVWAYAFARRTANRLGLQLVLNTYYSPIPDVRHIPSIVWEQADPMRGVAFELDQQLDFVRGLSDLLHGFTPTGGEYRYDFTNPSYPEADARLLYALIRRQQPRRIVELGSGHTTRVIAQACRENAQDGVSPDYRVYDPFPTYAGPELPGVTELVATSARDVPESVFARLREGDVLVVDTTHTVKLGSEVNWLVLQILPLLAPGVLVHFHDIWLPYEYPRYFADAGLYWGEQYLLQAFLAMNPRFEVVCAVHALLRERPDVAARAGLTGNGAAFWIRSVSV